VGFVNLRLAVPALANVKRARGERLSADFGADVDLADNIALIVELQHAFVVPLAHVQILPVKAEV